MKEVSARKFFLDVVIKTLQGNLRLHSNFGLPCLMQHDFPGYECQDRVTVKLGKFVGNEGKKALIYSDNTVGS